MQRPDGDAVALMAPPPTRVTEMVPSPSPSLTRSDFGEMDIAQEALAMSTL